MVTVCVNQTKLSLLRLKVSAGTSGRYQLHVHEVDALLVMIFEKSSVNPQQYTLRLPSETRMYIAAGNPVASKLLRP
jgi:hypothetical protein